MKNIGYAKLDLHDSVFQKKKPTTNDLESYHAKLKQKIKSHDTNFWKFIKKMNQIILATEKEMKRIDYGLSI